MAPHSESAFETPAITLQATKAYVGQPTAEAANLARLGNYSFVYAMLVALADMGLLAMVTVLGVPLDGAFGGVAISRLLLRLVAASAFILILYTWACSSDFHGNGWRRPGLQFFSVAVLLLLLALDHGDMTDTIVQLLRWTGDHAEYLHFCSEPGMMPG